MNPPHVLWVLLLGGVGFLAGFVGPMILVPEANQGPLVGIFITGPLGVVLGLVLLGVCAVLKVSPRLQWRTLWITTALLGGTTLFFLLPEPKLRGDIIEVQVLRCRSPAQVVDETLRYWNERIASVTWASPRPGWQEGMRQALHHDRGVVLDVQVRAANEIREHRKPWNSGKITASGWANRDEEKTLYLAAAPAGCSPYTDGNRMKLFVDRDFDIRPPAEWPPRELTEFIPYTAPLAVPAAYREF